MKAKVIATLAYPQSLVGGVQDLEECRHAGLFSSAARDCATCAQERECHWLYKNGEYAALEDKSLRELEDVLAFALGYVDSMVLQRQHNSSSCKCESCVWLRSARRVYHAVLEEVDSTV